MTNVSQSDHAASAAGESLRDDQSPNPISQEGYVLVPREPTGAMHDAARDWSAKEYGKPIGIEASDGCWKAMLAAAPTPPATSPRGVSGCPECNGDGYGYPNGIGDGLNHFERCAACNGSGSLPTGSGEGLGRADAYEQAIDTIFADWRRVEGNKHHDSIQFREYLVGAVLKVSSSINRQAAHALRVASDELRMLANDDLPESKDPEATYRAISIVDHALAALSTPSVGGFGALPGSSSTAEAACEPKGSALIPDLSKRSAESMTDHELWAALDLAGEEFDRVAQAMLDDGEGRGGSPMERYSERIDEIETALRRRGFNPFARPILPPPPATEQVKP